MSSPPGWYPDPGGVGQRYFDGHEWTPHQAPAQQNVLYGQAVTVTGPNHALHAILSLLTWPLLGGWIWVWLIIALANKRKTQIRSY